MQKRILILAHEDYEEMELHYPRYRLIEAGYQVVVAGPLVKTSYKGKHGYPVVTDATFEAVDSKEFAVVVVPGGFAPDRLRRESKVLRLLQEFDAQKKMIAFICHAGWVLISAKLLKGVRCTSTSAIKDDMENAGALWEDAPVIVDRHFISSRKPDDLPQFCKESIKFLESSR